MTNDTLAARPHNPDAARTLLSPTGEPIDLGQEGWVAPHAFNFASVLNTVSQAYSYRWDEALKDSYANAMAMKRDTFYLALHQERVGPTAGMNWTIKVDKKYGGRGQWVAERLTAAVEAIPDLTGMFHNQLEAVWYGRYGTQFVPGRAAGGVWTIREHRPVNGDKIQYGWDGTPIVLVSARTAQRYADNQGTIVPLDRGGWGLRLHRREWRERFVIHHHLADDADYFQGEMAGGVKGVGLRSRVYWSGWMRTEVLGWMVSFMQNVGMSDLIIFNYPTGNPEAKRTQEDNARKITNGVALLVARGPEERGYPAVEQIQMNSNGVKVLTDLVSTYYDRHIERLYVGQSMSAGADDSSGLGGTGRAKFAQDTKYQLIKTDARRLAETQTRDLLPWMQRKNCPGTEDIPARFEFSVPDPAAGERLDSAIKVLPFVSLKLDEVIEVAGFTVPGPHDETIGGPQMATASAPGQTPTGGGRAATDEEANDVTADLPDDLLGVDGGLEVYGQQDQWVPHTISVGPRKGQSVFMNARTGELRDAPPNPSALPSDPNAMQRGVEKVRSAGRSAGAAVSSALDRVPGGKVLKGLGRGAVAFFHAVEKPLMAAMASTQVLARQAAYERGLSDQHVEVLGRVLALADFAGGYGGAALGYAAAGPIGGKVGSFMPTTSVVYLAYSTARDPLATWRAAKRLARTRLANAGRVAGKAASAVASGLDKVADASQRLTGLVRLEGDAVEVYSADASASLADSLRGAVDLDWWQAVVMAGLGESGDPQKAAELATDMADQKPMTDAAEVAAAMIHLATMGQWPAVDQLARMADDPHGHEDAQNGPPSDDHGNGGQSATSNTIEQYARTQATWQPYTHPKTGRQGWKSAGGLVRYTRPGTLDAPQGPKIPHQIQRQRSNADAHRQAAELANRVAQGHPPTLDELAGLPALLRSLTSAQILGLNQVVGGHGGKLKADRIAHFVGKVNATLAAHPPAAPAARPPSGLREWTAADEAKYKAEQNASDEIVELVPAPSYEQYATAHAPRGGITLQGKFYEPGEEEDDD